MFNKYTLCVPFLYVGNEFEVSVNKDITIIIIISRVIMSA